MKKVILIFGLITCSFSFAQTKEQKVERLMEVMGMQKNMALMFDQMMQHYNETYPNVPSIFWTKFRENINYKDLQSKMIPVYSKHFTGEDIDGLIKFYQSPLGQKTITTLPQIMQESMAIGQEWGINIGNKIIEDLEKDGYLQNPPPPMETN
ncbi:DUF2059 domain-containing protein [Chryseobacterium sp. POL2]|uniref:DUF2059 domain-containing protein n=1 Tax=Chryseobacterium sp. POL2 TaxID=2713414 RepID=UPI0013E17ECD|nr:DUF2059 domain-containing protein [Chryseobacterium sp. POL2]QIG90436.1 DUF2059 domain-containing protein [Chryseobacterium sp. POL2]